MKKLEAVNDKTKGQEERNVGRNYRKQAMKVEGNRRVTYTEGVENKDSGGKEERQKSKEKMQNISKQSEGKDKGTLRRGCKKQARAVEDKKWVTREAERSGGA